MTKNKSPFSTEYLDGLSYSLPFMVTSLDAVIRNYQAVKTYFPEFEIYFAMKSNPDTEVLRALKRVGSNFEIASYGELKVLKSIDADVSRLIYSNPVKAPDHIRRSAKAGVQYFSFDSEAELKKIAENAAGSKVYLRLKVSDQGSAFPLSSKFGAPAEDTVKLMECAKGLGLVPAGLTFHVGSQATDEATWKVAIETAGRALWELQHVGITLEFLDIGGGLPAEYTTRIPEIKTIAKAIRHSLSLHLPYPVKLYMEPGRALVATSSVMATTVIGREKRGNVDWVYLDVGVFQGLIEALEMPGWKLPVFTSAHQANRSSLAQFTLTGPTCDAQDTIGHNILLPRSIDVGDRVYIASTGAYTLTYAAPGFNGFEPPKVYYDYNDSALKSLISLRKFWPAKKTETTAKSSQPV